ncbi:MAG TPA: S53 family peptidase [Candidatus Acidoferrales bacterium]|nr:S53 family peptidase [Candidatus Acidoferrales bacterium]
MPDERVVLKGSERLPVPGAQVIGSPDPAAPITVTVLLRRRNSRLPSPKEGHVSRRDFAGRFGADPADVPPIEEFAAENDLTVVEVDLARRSILLSGSVGDMGEAFGTELMMFQGPEGMFRGRVGTLTVPSSLAKIVTGVFGLDERPQARSHLRRHGAARVGPEAAGDTSYTPIAVSKLYDYPALTGSGQTVGIIELGGGYRSSDLKTYFSGLGIKTTPSVTAVSVDGGLNQPVGNPNSADAEVLLDIEVVGAIAPAAKIAVYFAPNTDQGFLDAITTAVHDNVRKPSVISISWGGPESSWTAQSLTAFDQAFQDAGLLGVTVCCASGDDGSSDGETDGLAHVDFPASSPHVLACGGTRLESSANKITKEVVWNEGANGATGGGVSDTFPLPSFQASAGVPVSVNPTHFKGRGVPDVSGDADPKTGYQVRVDGRNAVFGGTSAVAPLWAALIALINQQLKKSSGFVNTALYAGAGKTSLHDITSGNNGAYTARAGWDACTGLGSPDGQKLLTALTGKSKRKGSRRR